MLYPGKSQFPIAGPILLCSISLDAAPSLPSLPAYPPGSSQPAKRSSVSTSHQVQIDCRKSSCVSHKSHRRPEMVQ